MEPVKRKVKRGDVTKWEVDFGAVNGHRKRPLVHTEDDADDLIKKYRKDVKSAGEFWARLPDSERLATVATLVQIKEAGHTVTGVWEDWKRWRKDNQQTVTTPMAYQDVVNEWERRKLAAGKSKRYVHENKTVLNNFGEGRERQPIHEIVVADLEAWIDARCFDPKKEVQDDPLRTWGLSTKRTKMSIFSGLWEVAIAKGWASLNIADRLEPVGALGIEVKIYDNQTVMNVMAAAMENEETQRVIAPLALGFFGCMRPDEVTSDKALENDDPPFDWSCIDLAHGVSLVTREVAKKGDQRNPRLQPVAVEWLKLAKDLKNPLPPVNERRLIDQICEMIGLKDWIRDGMRKNCATHLRAVYKNDYDVVKDMGNSVRILLKHYADLHTPEEVSKEYWKISPKRVEEYRKTDAWRNLLVEASKINEEMAKANKAKAAEAKEATKTTKTMKTTKASKGRPGQSANENGTS